MRDGDRWFFDRFAPLYDVVMPPTDDGSLATAIGRSARPVERIVDVGGGTGRAVRAVDAPERMVVDASSGMLSRVPRSIAAVRGSATRLPMRAETVDAVLIVDALHHMPEQGEVLREAARVLRPGGVLVVREFDGSTLRGRLLAFGEHAIGMRSTFLSADEIADLVAGAELEPLVVERGFACTVVGSKPGGP